MQKIFMKYTSVIMTIAVFSILVINFYFSSNSLEEQQLSTFRTKIEQVIHTMENNKNELEAIKKNLDEDYLTRAKAAAYVVQTNPAVLESVEELKNLAVLLDVDEVHVTDSDGIISYSSVPEYIGLDFHNGKQMRGFLPILESDSEDAYIIQEAQPNTAEGKMMKYVGVARKGVKGLVQVGLEPVRQMEAQERNTYEYIFSRFPTGVGEEFFAIDLNSGEVVGYTGNIEVGVGTAVDGTEKLEDFIDGGYSKGRDGTAKYLVVEKYGDIMIGASVSQDIMYHTFWKNGLLTFCYLLAIEAVTLLLLNYLVKRKVVNGIHKIRDDLKKITDGNLNTAVDVGGNPEFEALSSGINIMVKSIVNSGDRISKIVAMSEIPLAAFEYQDDMKYVFYTTKLMELLDIPEKELKKLSKDPKMFLKKIRSIMNKPLDNEESVFCINEQKYVRMHITIEATGFFGAVTDESKEILEKRRILYENNHDQLTGLSRYGHFMKKACRILDGLGTDGLFACVMIDLDAFKQVNDTYGHDEGDKYLKRFAELMKSLPRDRCLIARRSGDEFCIFVHGCKEVGEVEALLGDFWDVLKKETITLAGHWVHSISASGGCVCTKGKDVELVQMLKQADIVLYDVKRKAKGSFAVVSLEGEKAE